MNKPNNEPIFLLIQSLTKGEKKNFRLFIQRHSQRQNLKIIQLFDQIERMKIYREEKLLTMSFVKPTQLANMKAHLYKNILTSLRLAKNTENIDIYLREQLDFARILLNKGLYIAALKILRKTRVVSAQQQQYSYLQQSIFLEKKIEGLYITRNSNIPLKVKELSEESEQVLYQLKDINELSNLSLQMYGWFIEYGHAKTTKDKKAVEQCWKKYYPYKKNIGRSSPFYQQAYFYQSLSWKMFIIEDYDAHLHIAEKWVNLFSTYPIMKRHEASLYIKSLHTVLTASYQIRNHCLLKKYLDEMIQFRHTNIVRSNKSNEVETFLYYILAQLNYFFLLGLFTEGCNHIKKTINYLLLHESFIDKQKIQLIYYKIACLYFGAGNVSKAIDYLNQVLNEVSVKQNTIQQYARILFLICHYEINNNSILPHIEKSIYRYIKLYRHTEKKTIEKIIIHYIEQLSKTKYVEEKKTLYLLFYKELHSFVYKKVYQASIPYLDITSWIESKINNMSIEQVIQKKVIH